MRARYAPGRHKILTYPSRLVIDEIGYLPVSPTGAMLFFQLINRRYERASTVLTSNKGFEDWGQILGDEVMAAALINRLLHHCHIVNTEATASGCVIIRSSPRYSTRMCAPKVGQN